MGSWIQEKRVSVDPKTGKETKTVMPRKKFKQESISREEFNEDKSNAQKKAAILAAKIEQKKNESKDEVDNEMGAPYKKQSGPRIDTKSELSEEDQLTDYFNKNGGLMSEDKLIKKVDESNQNKIRATLKGDKETAESAGGSMKTWNEMLERKNKTAKRWGYGK
jgi:hypothetical protein